MSNKDQQLQISINKIFNCTTLGVSQQLTVEFVSTLNQTPIFTKTTLVTAINSTLQLHCHFKVTYNPSETQLIASIFGQRLQERMTFVIDLEKLKQKKIQFLREEEGVRLMQINCSFSERKSKNYQNSSVQSAADTFISEKQKLISSYKSKYRSKNKEKNAFCQNLYSLLQEAKQIRRQMQNAQQQVQYRNKSQSNASQDLVRSWRSLAFGSSQLSLKDLKLVPSANQSMVTDHYFSIKSDKKSLFSANRT